MSLNLEQFQQAVQEENAIIIDTRAESLFLEGFIPGSIHFNPALMHQAAALGIISFEKPFVLVGDQDQEKGLIDQFEKLGFTNNKGWLAGGYNTWLNANNRIDLIIEVEADELAMDIPFDEFLMILDIREEQVYDQGHIKDSIPIPLLEFADPGSMSELDEHFNIYILSDDGVMNTLAASILKKQGIHNIRMVQGGWKSILNFKDKFKIEVTKPKKSQQESDDF